MVNGSVPIARKCAVPSRLWQAEQHNCDCWLGWKVNSKSLVFFNESLNSPFLLLFYTSSVKFVWFVNAVTINAGLIQWKAVRCINLNITSSSNLKNPFRREDGEKLPSLCVVMNIKFWYFFLERLKRVCMYSQYRRLIKYMELARSFNHYI